ncbi:MAG: 30S ribosomal protein S20 [Thermodesulfovibrio sp.]|uniref:30S ribosomal protein S20 n=1 Tax=unclassified Thermodesulfovibrio TaxID=2645936 RepID=UPI00083A3B0C|nr:MULTISPECIES: 30S ribosomal protein S20 [unclassified Thermodesulfovibrio]MDI1472202.1 30S ribosomal protein S20 [Thermodesulfovibrio sp. 1176]MDI6714065.1 30S ribosomal protein S20 [Thermodesulfovibrio sp.]ODA43860.1 SSU ribosomal protein S20p [Thermodesulfovibrio sp. N1]
MATKRSTVKKRSKSVLKRIRQNEKRKISNQAWRTRIKTSVKKVEEAIAKNEKELIQNVLKEAIKIINKAASKGIIHKNTASRKISRLMKKANSVLSVSASNN